MTRPTILARAILDRLAKARPYALPEEQLFTEVNGVVRPPATEEEFQTSIAALSTGGVPRLRMMADEFDDAARKWVITEAGEAALLR
ncbi:hypothetical protein CfE428DRAFT_5809 [Chthoniobacter flavus Ellin428]|uniref:Uncharacterized protein n=1 Tax=Chthoniobacter flavus Ellin428 TaxID=497964 RepID=B4DA69_9BACT|nr:hypothetical protein [Chthoniobacter flavus]EDY16696.1 hypothetical protein CfE428DRAFT_5809 [Chthoniobacter flavus Ellin428]